MTVQKNSFKTLIEESWSKTGQIMDDYLQQAYYFHAKHGEWLEGEVNWTTNISNRPSFKFMPRILGYRWVVVAMQAHTIQTIASTESRNISYWDNKHIHVMID